MTGRFRDQAAVVTGAAGGIGRATARRLVRVGASVLGGVVLGAELDETAALIAGDDAPDAIVAACRDAFAGLDILVNNAGIGGRIAVDDLSDGDWDRVLDTNLRSVFRLTRAALAAVAVPGGCIVNFASVFGLVGFPGSAAYGVAKAGVAQLTRQMAADYAPHGIRVNAVAPGVIDTPMTAKNIRQDAWYQRAMIETTPLGIGRPDDIAGAGAFPCSDDARFIAGEVLTVDGGWMATRYLPPD